MATSGHHRAASPPSEVTDADYEAMLARAAAEFAAEAAAWENLDREDPLLLPPLPVGEPPDGAAASSSLGEEIAAVEARMAELETRAANAARLCALRMHRLGAASGLTADSAASALANLLMGSSGGVPIPPPPLGLLRPLLTLLDGESEGEPDGHVTSVSDIGEAARSGDGEGEEMMEAEERLSLDRSLSVLVSSRALNS